MRLAIIAFALPLCADTVTTRDARSCNGRVSINNGIVQLDARFPAGARTVRYGGAAVRGIEFNGAVFNAGGPPNLPQPVPANSAATIYLTDRSGHRCTNLSILPDRVTCTAGSWPRQSVLRIIFD